VGVHRAPERGVLERAHHHHAEVIEVGGLEHEVVRAHLDRAHRVFHRAVAGEHDHGHRRIGLADLLQDAQAILVPQAQIEQHGVHALLAHGLHRLASARRLDRRVAHVAGPLADAEAQRALVIDDEERLSGLRARRAVAFRHAVSPGES
jgi:hypothetical protein